MAELDQALSQAIVEMRGLIDGLIGEQKAICFDLFSQEFAEIGVHESRSGLTSFRGSAKTPKHPTTGGLSSMGGGTAQPASSASSPHAGSNFDASHAEANSGTKRSSKFHMAVIKPGGAENDLQHRLEALRRSLDERAARDRSL